MATLFQEHWVLPSRRRQQLLRHSSVEQVRVMPMRPQFCDSGDPGMPAALPWHFRVCLRTLRLLILWLTCSRFDTFVH